MISDHTKLKEKLKASLASFGGGATRNTDIRKIIYGSGKFCIRKVRVS